MEKLGLKKFEDKRLQDLTSFIGCGNSTTWYTNGEIGGSDTYDDDNGDGVLSSGDTIWLDDGRVVCK